MTKLTVNGKAVSLDADPNDPLLWALRKDLQLTGTKVACGMFSCRACTVHLNGHPVRACQAPMSAAAGRKITTSGMQMCFSTRSANRAFGPTAVGKPPFAPQLQQ